MELMNSKWVNRNLVFYGSHKSRWLKAIGPDVVNWEMPRCGAAEDNTTNDPTWAAMDLTGAGTQVAGTAAGVGLLLTTAGAAKDGPVLQVEGSPFALAANKPLYFGAKVEMDEATSTAFYMGLCATRAASIMPSYAIHGGTVNHVGFHKSDGTTAITYWSESGGSASNSSAATMTTAARIYEFYYDGASVSVTGASPTLTYWVDGSQVGQITSTSTMPTVAMRPTIGFLTGSSSVQIAQVHWWKTIQIR